jgi:hypothetical protein
MILNVLINEMVIISQMQLSMVQAAFQIHDRTDNYLGSSLLTKQQTKIFKLTGPTGNTDKK